ncbi:histidine phosphatase family protein [Paenibacillus cremeus]|uniref:Histidine phosphatase family protein n=1 Tax=Paenibacillus cremeus TaxID=2163881 RepID=A0A559JBN6_9BACL|nr:histidine phosphatase family protein [Paenibacillus cremeus]TVX97296.1 histidine phosphatase family protein [Paenibacillus cremeus]
MKKLFLAGILSLLLINPITKVEAAGFFKSLTPAAPSAPSLLNLLRQGGYILYARHGEATEGEDQPNLHFDDCSTQRNLSKAGKIQAAQFGKALRDLQIRVQTPVQASPYCRTRETAALAFSEGNVQTDPFWVKINNFTSLPHAQQQAALDTLTSVLEQTPAPGTNRVIIAHSFPDGVGLGTISPLTTVVVKPRGLGKGFEVVDRITLDELLKLR